MVFHKFNLNYKVVLIQNIMYKIIRIYQIKNLNLTMKINLYKVFNIIKVTD